MSDEEALAYLNSSNDELFAKPARRAKRELAFAGA
jgi:hypothetical protein